MLTVEYCDCMHAVRSERYLEGCEEQTFSLRGGALWRRHGGGGGEGERAVAAVAELPVSTALTLDR
jgi:hypothetical protein